MALQLRHHPPNTPGGTLKTPGGYPNSAANIGNRSEMGSPDQLLGVHQAADQTPLLHIHRPILDKSFHNIHTSGSNTPGETHFSYVKCQFTYKPVKFFPYKKSAEVSPKNFSWKIPSPQATNWQLPGHQLAPLEATGQRAPSPPRSFPMSESCPLQAPGLAEHLMGVWNTQIEPRSG